MEGLYLAGTLEERHKRVLANTRNVASVLLNADKDRDGKLDSEEQLKAIESGLWSADVRQAILSSLDCKNDSQTVRTLAAETSVQIKRTLDVLRTNKPGTQAKELAGATIDVVVAKFKQSPGSMPGTSMPNISPEQSTALKGIYENYLLNEDIALLREYQAMKGKNQNLPTEVLPIDTSGLCRRAGTKSI